MDTTISNLPAGIATKEISSDFRYIYRDREAYNHDLYKNDFAGESDFGFYPPIVAEKKRQEDIQVVTSGKGMHWTVKGKNRDGNLIILDKRKIQVNGDELSSLIVVNIEQDIAEPEMMKRELLSSKKKAEMFDGLESAFFANMSHEIRTPLNAIVGSSHLITESDDAGEQKTYYSIVNANNERLSQLISEILDFSRTESETIEFSSGPTSLRNLRREVYDAHIFYTPQGVSLIYESSDESSTIETDKNRVLQVISNLTKNTVKLTKEGSISYDYKLMDNQIVSHVTDTETGIEPEKVGRVFERLTKLSNHAQGIGLGLSICKPIVERPEGKISIGSEFGRETTFTFILSYTVAESVNTDSEKENDEGNSEGIESTGKADDSNNQGAENEETKGARRFRILVAEDTDSNFELLEVILYKDYRLIRVHGGMEAVVMYGEVEPDLTLIDIEMPNLDGLEATEVIRELSVTVPITARSVFTYEQDRKMAKEVGCNDSIAKPIADDKLKVMIHKWLSPP